MTSLSSSELGLQPFQCILCQRRFTRRENLKRHASLHTEARKNAPLSCQYCEGTFARQDLRQRHMQRKHPDRMQRTRQRRKSAMASPHSNVFPTPVPSERDGIDSAVLADNDWDEEDGVGMDLSSTDDSQSVLSQSPVTYDSASSLASSMPMFSHTRDSTLASGMPLPRLADHCDGNVHETWPSQSLLSDATEARPHVLPDEPSEGQIITGLNLFFTHVSPFLPFIHRPTLALGHIPRYFLLAMLSLGYQYGEDPGGGTGSGAILSQQYFNMSRQLLAAIEPDHEQDFVCIIIVQTYLLLEVEAILYLCGPASRLGLELHSRMIAYARAKGLMYPALDGTQGLDTEDLEQMWQAFVRAESQKRTLHSVLQIDALWYQLLSVPRSISHLEIKHDLPCADTAWNASTSAQWAHRQLRSTDKTPLTYAEAVRRFISPEAQARGSVPPMLDSYGAISVAQFLLSSMREVSGWASLTGRVSMDRFEPLKASVLALEPSIRPHQAKPMTADMLLCEATWEMAMIELHLWSRSHVGGIVQSSFDDALCQLTYQANTGEAFILDASTIQACQPHIDWFVRYLQRSGLNAMVAEPPWIMLYAHKAFVIAWELVRRGESLSDAMQAVGLQSGDTVGCLRWARSVFQGRLGTPLGVLIHQSIEMLESQA